MKVQPAAFLRTTLPLDLGQLERLDSGRYHSIWLPDHMVSFWPDSIWTEEFTELATVSPSPHRYLDSMAVAGAVSVLTEHTPIATSVTDTVRRHPAMLAQTALTLSHLSKGRFVLGVSCGEHENTVPYGLDFSKPVSRFEEALEVITLLWSSEGTVDHEGKFFHLQHARLDTEPYDGKVPPIWIGGNGPRMLDIAGRYADGWWPADIWSPEDYERMLTTLKASADRAGRDPEAIVPGILISCFIGDDDELAEIMQAPLVKAYVLQMPASLLRSYGYEHPMGPDWRGFHDIDPGLLTRERIVEMCEHTDPQMILDVVPHGTPEQLARRLKDYVDAGLRVPKILDYGGMAGLAFGARSAEKVRQAEDELLRLCGDVA